MDGDLFALAEEYLAAVEAAVATSPGGPIDRSFVSPGPPAWDCCPQLTVHVGGPAIGDIPSLEAGRRTSLVSQVNVVTLTATVIRCAPVSGKDGKPPTAAALHTTAAVVDGDLWAIWNFLSHTKAEGLLFPPVEREFFLDPAVPLGPQGGCAGWQIQVRTQLSGYAPTL